MSPFSFKKRRKRPISIMNKKIQASIQLLASTFLKSDVFTHSPTKGTQREIPVRDFFKENIPGKFSVTTGEVVDLFETHSPQLDVMIFDSQRNFPFYFGDQSVLPAEALLVSIEVKSKLNKHELTKSFEAAKKLRILKPYGKESAPPRERGERADKRARYFHCLFAYDTDLSEKNWLETENSRTVKVARSLGIPVGFIDRLYVANHGLLNLTAQTGVTESNNSGYALMNFYMHIMNFLIRENGRRPQVPYIDYMGRLSEGWINLK